MRKRLLAGVVLVASLLAVAVTVEAQFRRGPQLRYAIPEDYEPNFMFCRIVFRNAPTGDGGGWGVDFPRADENLSTRLSELTKTPIAKELDGTPRHLLVRLSGTEINMCPFVMMTEPGGLGMDSSEAFGLRKYLEKGGFMWADDFWGTYAYDHFVRELRKALPAEEYPIFELPPDHPLYQAQFEVKKVPQIPSIGFWDGGSRTSERDADSAITHGRGIADKHGRLMVFMTHNTDLGDSFEREGDDPRYFYAFGPNGYALGINILLYAMTH